MQYQGIGYYDCDIMVYSQTGKVYGNDTPSYYYDNLDSIHIGINNSLLSCTTTKSLGEGSGTFSITLINNQDSNGLRWSDILNPQDLVVISFYSDRSIYFKDKGSIDVKPAVVMVGIINVINSSIDYDNNNPVYTIEITGKDVGQYLEEAILHYWLVDGSGNANHQFTDNQIVFDRINVSIKNIIEETFYGYYSSIVGIPKGTLPINSDRLGLREVLGYKLAFVNGFFYPNSPKFILDEASIKDNILTLLSYPFVEFFVDVIHKDELYANHNKTGYVPIPYNNKPVLREFKNKDLNNKSAPYNITELVNSVFIKEIPRYEETKQQDGTLQNFGFQLHFGKYGEYSVNIIVRPTPFMSRFSDTFSVPENTPKGSGGVTVGYTGAGMFGVNWNALPVVIIDKESDVLSEDLNRSKNEVFNYFHTNFEALEGISPINFDMAGIKRDSSWLWDYYNWKNIQKYGIRKYSCNMKYIPAIGDLCIDGTFDTDSLKNFIKNPAKTNTNISKTMIHYNEMLHDWFIYNDEMLSGKFVVRGNPDIKIGKRLRIFNNSGIISKDNTGREFEYYIEEVTHTFKRDNTGGNFTTTVYVTRGFDKNRKLTSPGGEQTDILKYSKEGFNKYAEWYDKYKSSGDKSYNINGYNYNRGNK
jgi:hypothetical protein